MVAKQSIRALMPGLYHINPTPAGAVDTAGLRVGSISSELYFLPADVTDFLVADSVNRELAFDLENRGITGADLRQQVGDYARGTPLEEQLMQNRDTLSGGERQLLALLSALRLPHKFLLGFNCLDFISDENSVFIESQLSDVGKILLNITGRSYPEKWMIRGELLEQLATESKVTKGSGGRPQCRKWSLQIADLHKEYFDSDFRLHIKHLKIDCSGWLGIHGNNGAGKTTFAECLLQLNEFHGAISLQIDGTIPDDLGMLPQRQGRSHGFESSSSCIDTFQQHGKIDSQRSRALALWLANSADYRYIEPFDRACGYRLLIAAILIVGQYDAAILDEPAYGLPAAESTRFLKALVDQFGGRPLLLISHDRNFLSELCGQVVFLKHGTVHDRTN